MRVSSYSSTAVRRAPQQDRAARRMTAFLQAAEALFAEVGFEATTMTAVAERSESSIGALYSYFPDKRSLAMALLEEYAKQIEAHWKPLFDEVLSLTAQQFAERFLQRFLDFVQEHPAYLQLLGAPIRFRRDPAARRAFRQSLMKALQKRMPGVSNERAMLCANLVLQMVKGMMLLYAEAAPKEKPAVIAEVRRALSLYLQDLFVKK